MLEDIPVVRDFRNQTDEQEHFNYNHVEDESLDKRIIQKSTVVAAQILLFQVDDSLVAVGAINLFAILKESPNLRFEKNNNNKFQIHNLIASIETNQNSTHSLILSRIAVTAVEDMFTVKIIFFSGFKMKTH